MAATSVITPLTEELTLDADADIAEGLLWAIAELVIGRPDTEAPKYTINVLGANSGAVYQNATFGIRDYCWCEGSHHGEIPGTEGRGLDDDEGMPACPPNFVHFATGITVEWYKRIGRSMYSNRDLNHAQWQVIALDCIESVIRDREENGVC